MIGKVNTGGAGLALEKPLIHIKALTGATAEIYFDNKLIKRILSDKSIATADGEQINFYYSTPFIGVHTIKVIFSDETIKQIDLTINTNKQYDVDFADTVTSIKTELLKSGWTALSNTIGDKFQNASDRVCTRTTSEPVILLTYSGNGFGIISLYSTFTGSYTQYGDPRSGGTFTTPNGTIYYTFYQWATIGNSEPIYTIDGTAYTFPQNTAIPYIDSQNNFNISCTDDLLLNKIYEYIDRLALVI